MSFGKRSSFSPPFNPTASGLENVDEEGDKTVRNQDNEIFLTVIRKNG